MRAQPPMLAPEAPLFIVFNPGSGRGDADAVRSAIEGACRAAGRPCHWYVVGPDAAPPQLAAQAVRDAVKAQGIAVAAGGDGTLNAVAQAVLPAGCAFGVLPQGTFNYFGRTHGIPTNVDEAIDALLAARPVAVQAGQVNDRVFLVNASMGLYARSLADRETVKSRLGRNRISAAIAALMTLLRGHRHWDLEITEGGRTRRLRTPTLFIGNNALQFEQIGVAEGEEASHGVLTALAMEPVGRLALFGLLLSAAQGRLGDDPRVHSFSFDSLTVSPLGRRRPRRVRVACDGELMRMDMPLTFRVVPQPLWLMVPPPALAAERE